MLLSMLNTLCYTALHATRKVDHTVLHCILACVCICIVCWPQNLVEVKAVLGQQELLTSAYGLIAVGSMTFDVLPPCPPLLTLCPLSLSLQGALASSEPMLRCAAGEALGRMSQVGGEANFVTQIAQTSFDTLKTTREAVSRMGHSLVLGCLHRYVGGMGSGQHLQTSVRILHSLTQDTSSPTVQVQRLY